MLPANWADRVQALSGGSTVHVPASLRERFAAAMAQGLEDMLEGGCHELGRTKLLMAPVPQTLHRRRELEERLNLWHAGSLAELLLRIEQQARAFAEQRSMGSSRANPASRAKKLAQSGA